MIKKIIHFIKNQKHYLSSDRYIAFLRSKGITIGENIGKYNQMVNSSGSVTIGNNIYFGADCTVLKGVSIGDNCIIGARSVVTKSIPPNSVAVGNPCKVIYSLDEYFAKRLKEAPLEAKENVIAFYNKYGRYPNENELTEEAIYYSDSQRFTPHNFKFSSYQEFLDWCKNDN